MTPSTYHPHRVCVMAMAHLPQCTFESQVDHGLWNFSSRTFRPQSCLLRPLTRAAVRSCLRNRTLTFIGDSVLRELSLAVANLLSGLDGSTGEPADAAWLSADKGEPAFVFPVVGGSLRRMLFGPSPVRNTAGSRGEWHLPSYGITVRNFNDAARAIHWPSILTLAHDATRAGHERELLLVGLGIHDTNGAISEFVGSQASLRWKSDPLLWTHGPVFQVRGWANVDECRGGWGCMCLTLTCAPSA